MSRGLASLTLFVLLVTSAGAVATDVPQDDDALYAGANQRIEQHRMADATIVVYDTNGIPLKNAVVEIEQIRHQFLFGCNIFRWGRAGDDADEQQYRERFADVFNFATLPFYWPPYEKQQGQSAHENREEIAHWCLANGITPKGHPLAWNYSEPKWLPNDPEAILALQLGRIDEIVARFKGLIDTWDVVNEATHFERDEFVKRSPKLTAMWQATGREAFTLQCLAHARAANPRATLLVNDYRTDQAFADLLQKLVDANNGKPPFDVIGIQSHQHDGVWSNQKIWETCERFAKFGLPLHFTETTITSGALGWELAENGRDWPSIPEKEIWQADEVERFYTMVFSHPAVEAITWWDFADRNAWQKAPAGLLRVDLSAKPAYDRLHELIKKRWWTTVSLRTDENGEAPFRGFLGDYRVTVRVSPDDATTIVNWAVTPGNTNRLIVPIKLP